MAGAGLWASTLPPCTSSRLPSPPSVQLVSVILDTAATEYRASPRKPNVRSWFKSSKRVILLVA